MSSSWQWLTLTELFEGFHGRGVWEESSSNWIENTFPPVFRLVGQAVHIRYFSDKRDPGDPFGEGAQGNMKLFQHPFDGGVMLFDPLGDGSKGGSVPLEVNWPKQAAKLGSVEEIVYLKGGASVPSVERWREGQMELWVWGDKRTLMMIDPKSLNIALLRGGNMRVEPRGIVH